MHRISLMLLRRGMLREIKSKRSLSTLFSNHGVRRASLTQTSVVTKGSHGASAVSSRFSTTVTTDDDDNDTYSTSSGPSGTLFHASIDSSLKNKFAEIRRTFDARSNYEGLLVCGGRELAKHASFDPSYTRAQTWIRHHAVGPAVLSPLLLNGLVQALVEAAMPQSITLECSMKQHRPMIVGVQVCARIEVVNVVQDPEQPQEMLGDSGYDKTNDSSRSHGYQVSLQTSVARVRDGALIASGTHDIWIPDYMHM